MAKINSSDLGRSVKLRLMELDETQDWLVKQVKAKTEKYFDSRYLWKILSGEYVNPEMLSAICEILDLDMPDKDESA